MVPSARDRRPRRPVLSATAALVALSGVDTTGTFYAAQTLRQLVTGSRLPVVTVRDWPTASLRGVIEGFHGTPWSHAERLVQLDFYGRTKQKSTSTPPKDDAYLRPAPTTSASSTRSLPELSGCYRDHAKCARLQPGTEAIPKTVALCSDGLVLLRLSSHGRRRA